MFIFLHVCFSSKILSLPLPLRFPALVLLYLSSPVLFGVSSLDAWRILAWDLHLGACVGVYYFRASEGWCLLGYAYMESGDLLSASRAFAAATAAAPAAAPAYLGGGQIQALLHNWPAAERLYATAVRCR